MKKLSLAVIGCVMLAGCAEPQQSTPPAASKSALLPIVQTVTPEEPILKANETVTPYVLFDKAIRIGSVDDKFPDYYVLFSPDGKLAQLYSDNGKKHETLERRFLPKGGYVWNVEDDDTKNLRYKNGVWTIEKRMQRIGSQSTSDVDASLGPWEEEYYEGVLPAASCLGIRYQFTIRHCSYSGDGTYHLAMTYLEAEKGKDLTFESIGKQLTQRGTSEDSDATVWQLIDDNGKHEANFVYEPMNQTLTLLTKDFKRIESSLDYSLKRKSKR